MAAPEVLQRHGWNVRICHWINVICAGTLLVSGMAILLDYPELYWGHVGYKGHEPAFRLADVGITMEGSRQWGRNTHFLFSWIFAINGIVYVVWNLMRGGMLRRLWPTREQWSLRHIAAELRDHLKFRAPRGEAARHYNVLQKLTYLFVIFVLAPTIILTGLAQAPGFTAAVPELLTIFGGKQSARTIHFACTVLLLGFVLVHVAQVFVAGAVNEIRSMITGRYVVPEERR
jgi:thiosulfate reductase cytochrome b subunit